MDIIKSLWKNRLAIFFGFSFIFIIFNYITTGQLLPSTATKDMWFYSGLFMVLFSTLFIEPYYSSPKNVIANVVPILLVMLAIHQEFTDKFQWFIIVIILIVLLIMAITAMTFADSNQSPTSRQNRIAERLKNITLLIGRGKILYSGVFLYFLFTYYVHDNMMSGYVFGLLIIWAIILTVNQNDLRNSLFGSKKEKYKTAVGQIFGIESQKMFLVKLFDNSRELKKFDVVKFNYSMGSRNTTFTGIVFDYYLLNQERWVKVLQLDECKTYMKHYLDNTVYAAVGNENKKLQEELNINNFVGVVIENSKIGKIKFEYSKSEDNMQEGDLVQLGVGSKILLYQVVSGTTDKEQLEARNEAGFIEGEASQLGEWDNTNLSFNKFGWVPQINTPIFSADTSKIEIPSHSYPEFQIGKIPSTDLPSILNLDQAISHHTALLGVTGSGKSYLARKIIDQLKTDTKVICVDFTGEWKNEIEDAIILDKDNIDNFLNGDDKFGIVELPALSNTVEVVAATEKLLSIVFNHAKKQYDNGDKKKFCLVLEEAHTIVPEASFLGVNNWDSKAIVNKMGQIALQGRKYGVGLLVIAQRTANVSKTVLTQCNTVICFQAFDETSFNFLSNYVGKDMVEALPNLRQYHAIVTGKAVKSNVPMIIDLSR